VKRWWFSFVVPFTLSCLVAGSARAQSAVEFFPRADFRMDAEHISSNNILFVWDANFGGDVDFFDWNGVRASFLANYEVVLDNELRNFAPNSGNYVLEPSVSTRVRNMDLAFQFHHVSRHLADAAKIGAIDWNMLGGRVHKSWTSGDWSLDGRGDVRRVIRKSFVDYNWEVEGQLRAVYAWRPRVGFASHVIWHTLTVDGSRNRGTQTGGRAEGGVRLQGNGGAVELFLAAERRVDPYPLEFFTDNWLTTGFRFTSR
jgi:hypothetical protein